MRLNFSLYLMFALGIILTQSRVLYADCSKLEGEAKEFCETLEKIENNQECQSNVAESSPEASPKTNPASQSKFPSLCITLKHLVKGGNCEEFLENSDQRTYLTCGELYRGLQTQNCDPKDYKENSGPIDSILPARGRKTLCNFGKYLARNFGSVMKTRARALVEKMMEDETKRFFPHVELKSQTEKKACPPFQQNRDLELEKKVSTNSKPLDLLLSSSSDQHIAEKVSRLASLLYPKFRIIEDIASQKNFSPKQIKRHITPQELIFYLKNLVTTIEKNKAQWVQTAKDKNTPLYFPVDSKGNDVPPSKVEVYPNGDIRVYFTSIRGMNNKKYKVVPLGDGHRMVFYPSLDYEKEKRLATGFLSIKKVRQENDDLEYNREKLTRGFLVQSILSEFMKNNPGIAVTEAPEEFPKKKKIDTKNLIVTADYYPTTLEKYSESLNSNQYDTIEGKTKEEIKLRLARDILRGLQRSHKWGVIHQDMKPENILVTDEKVPSAKITDFELARFQNITDPDAQSSAYAGSPLYFPPELLRDEKAMKPDKEVEKDPHRDTWALGLILHELDQGKPLQPNVNPKLNAEEQNEQFLNNLAMVYSYQSINRRLFQDIDFDPKYPPDENTLAYVIYRALNPNPEARPDDPELIAIVDKALEYYENMNKSESFKFEPSFELSQLHPAEKPIDQSQLRTFQEQLDEKLRREKQAVLSQ